MFNLYLKLPFGKMDARNSQVIEIAKLINRTPSAVAMRLCNFASVDPYHQQRGIQGLEGGKKQCEPIFERFINDRENLMYESEKILANLKNESLLDNNELETKESDFSSTMRESLIKTRVNQNLFRKIVLANYGGKCAISNITIPNLLVASHIVPWATDEKNRLNPANGICLNALYDRAYDNGLLSIDLNYKVILSSQLKGECQQEYFKIYFANIENKKINLPEKFLPNKTFLDYHLNHCFKH
ncbi:HNH endonuclease [Helicobacter cetorum]|uniref:Restriction endonuclease n=1 Tax=Helicobacter cetorum (strain ATCC BAA-429 / MIT 00-7128) TaxID=182217 RepID=I0EM98_HELC0|nr:HNH endonuclease [Helicobacter cetorum]AFI04067.1 restriction endonuclease [Helicobacter cetorum MIT 00-7128]